MIEGITTYYIALQYNTSLITYYVYIGLLMPDIASDGMTICIGEEKIGGRGGRGTMNLKDGALEENQVNAERGCRGG
jgi:hypothetical protein